MDYKIMMPRLSDSMDEGELVEWKIRAGEVVKNGDVVAEVESDKAVMEIQTFKSGTVKEILIKPGTTVPVGTAIAVIETARTGSSAKPTEAKTKEKHPVEKSMPAETLSKQTSSDVESVPKTAVLKEETLLDTFDTLLGTSMDAKQQTSSYTGGNSSPRARALAAKYGLDIEKLQEEKHLSVPAHMEDIQDYWLKRYFTKGALSLIRQYHLSTDLFGRDKKHNEAEVKRYIEAHEVPRPEPLNMLHRTMISMLNEAVKKPVYHMTDHIDMTLLNRYTTKELSITVWLLKLFAEAMMHQKYFRMSLTQEGIQLWPNASLSLAMASGEYLYMPVFMDINKKTLQEIAEELQKFKMKIEKRKLRQKDLSGSTFGISNLGMTGIEQFDAMINKNDCAIAAVGSEIEDRITLTLTVDHRIVNGYQAALFMQELKTLAEDDSFFKTYGNNINKG